MIPLGVLKELSTLNLKIFSCDKFNFKSKLVLFGAVGIVI